MSYDGLLNTVASLAQDPQARARLAAVPDAFLEEAGLTDTEKGHLTELDERVVARVASMFFYHRHARLADHLPWLNPLVFPELMPLLEAFVAETIPAALNREEADAFCRFAQERLPHTVFADLARYSQNLLEVAWDPQAQRRQLGFGWPVLTILEGVARGERPPLEPRACRLELYKVPMIPAAQARGLPET